MTKDEEELMCLEKLVADLIIQIEKNEEIMNEIELDEGLEGAYKNLTEHMHVE